jgi:hypothetical protein
LAIAIWGRPANAESGSPRRIQARWMKALRLSPPYQASLRSAGMLLPPVRGWI